MITHIDLLHIADDFNKWLEETATVYGITPNELQEIIHDLLN